MFNFKSRFIFIVFVFLFLFAISYSLSTVFAEDLTITTYYPSPYGSYNQLQSNSLGIGDNSKSNGLTSADVPDPATNPGDVWIAGKVGIGTGIVIPAVRLVVAGQVMITGGRRLQIGCLPQQTTLVWLLGNQRGDCHQGRLCFLT